MNIFPTSFYTNVLSRFPPRGLAMEFLEQQGISDEVIHQMHLAAITDSGYWFLHLMRQHYSEDELREFGILIGEGNDKRCFFPGHFLLLPYFDLDGELTGIETRYFGHLIHVSTPEIQFYYDKLAAEAPRQQFSPFSDCRIYNVQILKTLSPTDELHVCDDTIQCLQLLSQGKKAIALNSHP